MASFDTTSSKPDKKHKNRHVRGRGSLPSKKNKKKNIFSSGSSRSETLVSTLDENIEKIQNREIESNYVLHNEEIVSNQYTSSWEIPVKSHVSVCDAHTSNFNEQSVPPVQVTFAQLGKFFSHNRRQYIKKRVQTKKKIDQLNLSARFTFVNMEIKLHNEGCIMTTDNNFIAIVKLEHPEQLDECSDFEQAKKVLINQLRITKIIRDDLMELRNNLRARMVPAIANSIRNSAFNQTHANNYIQLVKITNMLKNSRKLNYRSLCREICMNKTISDNMKTFSKELLQLEETTIKREKWFTIFGVQIEDKASDLSKIIDELLPQSFERFRNTMVESAPECLQNFLRGACEKRIALISGEDIKLFMNMCTFLNKDIFEKPLKDLTICWINLVNSVKINETKEVVRFTQPIYFFLCKSLEEVIIEISNKTGIEKSKLLISDNNGWYANKAITWKQDNSLSRCLEHEYNFIFKLLKHFELTNRAIRPFNYSVVLLNRQKTSAYGNFIESAKRMFFNKSKNHLEVSDDVYIWYCMLDEVLSNVLPFASLKHGGELDLFRNILQNYTKLVREAGHDQLETVRVISHSLGRFIVQAIQLLKQDGNSDIEQRVLRGQLDVNSRVGFKSSNHFRDFINVFSDYWRCRNEVIALLPSKMNLPEMDIICNKLVEIIAVALGKKVDADEMVNFFRVFNDFIIDSGEVQFDWFIKKETVQKNNVDSSVLSMIDNKWKNSDNATYRVIKIEEFLNFFDSPPNHYVIDIIDKLLSTIMIQMNRKDWGPNQDLSETDQVATTSSLISAIRSTLIYLDEQPDYVSFDRFLEERVNPFVSVVENSTNYSEFSSRISLIKESFWYIRKQNEMSIDYALEMFDNLNENVDKNLLQKSYDIYCDRFDKIMKITMGKQHTEKISFIIQKNLKSVQQIHFKHWSQRFKQHTLPIILAELAAIWSIQVSKDLSSTVGFFKPHCIQVLCVLRMLSADQIKEGVEKHFAQVLTGQGKSLVLALTATILALTGHKVDLVCYNTYLVQKDETEFEHFFKTLKVNENIEYKTFDSMANALITSDINGERVGLRKLVNNMILDKPQSPLMTKDNCTEDSVLLIDEADVFFTEAFYGKSYMPAVCPVIPGLATIQEYIWNLINNNVSLADVQRRTQEFIETDAFEYRAEFNQFRTDKMKELLEKIDGNLTRKTYTNKTLLNKHLQRMITCAWEVKHSASVWSMFKLNDNKTICMMDETGEFKHNYKWDYYLVFNYMRLKETNFVAEIEDVQNFGYLNIECGAISYALLPLNYPLILGVSGTLTDLNFHEKFAIENLYKIKQSSVMPSFFGCSNLCFNEEEDFHCSYAVDEWLNQVYRHTYTKIAKNRAVIIFFEDDEKLEKFRKEYSAQFDRVNVLTVNTKGTERDQFINEAGVAKTVTLATRRMGRGVDFKSSVTVEKNGGVHVIQTFLSSDVKEEIQIKGRTARKDNKGSYELIVCECDLPVMEAETPLFLNYTYKILDNDRKNKSLKTNEKLSAEIKQAQKDHELTMEYMKSFSKEK